MRQGDPLGKDKETLDNRGSGRTYRQLEKLQAGDIFLVHNEGHLRYCTHMLHEKFGSKGVMIKVAVNRHPDWLRGMRSGTWVEVDHWLWTFWNNSQNDRTRREFIEYREQILVINSRSGRLDE